MRIGLFCTYENPTGDYARCFDVQTRLIRHAEAIGFEEAWIAEHHFDDDAVSPSILPMLAHLAGVTTRIRLGSAAVLLAFRNPIQVAEDVATIDVLSHGRFDFGVAKGGPFPLQNEHFHVAPEETRDRALEALEMILRLFAEERVTFSGRYSEVRDLTLCPKPVQKPLPVWLATSTPDAIVHAARHGFGIMSASLSPVVKVAEAAAAYRAAAPGGDPRLALARFYYVARTREEALAEALPFIRRFADRMRGMFLAQNRAAAFDPADIIERSLIGSHDDVAEKIIDIQRRVAPRSLLLKPATADEGRAMQALEDYVSELLPRIEVEVQGAGA